MKFKPLSKKQGDIFRFTKTKYSALICDGAVRSGKTTMMIAAYVLWAMSNYSGMNFGICGKTVSFPVESTSEYAKGYKWLK